MSANDRQIVCQDCGESFTFSAAEEEFFRTRNLTQPKRCKNCRADRSRGGAQPARPVYPTGDPNEYRSPMQCEMPQPVWPRQARTDRFVAAAQGNQGADPQATERHNFRGPSRRRFGQRQLFVATCSQCGATAHVPFEPSRGQQVFCKPCYAEKRGAPVTPESSADSEI